MLRIKNDWRNKLWRVRLEALHRISEEGSSVENINPDIVIEIWYNEKVWRFSAGSQNYPKKKKNFGKAKHVFIYDNTLWSRNWRRGHINPFYKLY